MQPAQQKVIAGVVVAAIAVGGFAFFQHEHKMAKASTTKPTTAHAVGGHDKHAPAPDKKHHGDKKPAHA